MLTASDTMRAVGFRSKFEMSDSQVFSIEDKQTKLLLNKTDGLYPGQTGLGRIVGVNSDTGFAYMLALAGKSDPIGNLYKAMNKAGKDVELVDLGGDDHWLSTSESRLHALEEIDRFLMVQNPPN